jgi:biopolymer transport protein ExbB
MDLAALERLLASTLNWLPADGLRLLEHGGPVLPFIGILSGVLWLLIAERYWFLLITHRRRLGGEHQTGAGCTGSLTLPCRWLRAGRVSEMEVELTRRLGMIEAITGTLPLLGLLGTVEGMIEVFHVLALHGSGNVRAMAGGISAALISTLAGLVTALSGLYFGSNLRERVALEVQRVRDVFE